LDRPAHFGNKLFAICPAESVIGRYIFYYCLDRTFQHEFRKVTAGIIGGVSLSKFREIPVPLPSPPEQRDVVAILDEAFDGIAAAAANAKRNIGNARELFSAELKKLFDGLQDVEQLRLSSAAITFARGKSRHRPRNDPCLYGGQYPFIQTGDVRNADRWVNKSTKNYNEHGLAQSKLWPAGTICITIAANIAETAILGFDACFPDSIIGMIVDPKRTTSEYVLYMLEFYREILKERGQGSAQNNINVATFETEFFPFPARDRQDNIVLKLNELSAEIGKLEKVYTRKLTVLAELKHSFLARAFSGDLSSAGRTATARAGADATPFATPEHVANVIVLGFWRHELAGRQNTFGRVKAQKFLHSVECIGGVDLGRQPMKDAAGPNDSAHMRKAEDWAKRHQFFEFVPRGRGYEFRKLARYQNMLSRASDALKPIEDVLKQVNDLLAPMDSERAEIFATVHAAWNNLILDGVTTTDNRIVREAREDWHSGKRKIPERKFHDMIGFIRKKGLVPDGTAKRVGGQGTLF
jgi:restriction endonuclease S subunit